MSINYERTLLLLSVIEKCAGTPTLNSIAGIAGVELYATNEEAKSALAERAEKIREEEQIAQQKALAEAEEANAAAEEANKGDTPQPYENEPTIERRL